MQAEEKRAYSGLDERNEKFIIKTPPILEK